jgi:hypothetical protein
MLFGAAKRAPVGKMMLTGFVEHPLTHDASESTCGLLPIVQQIPSLAVRARVGRHCDILASSADPNTNGGDQQWIDDQRVCAPGIHEH